MQRFKIICVYLCISVNFYYVILDVLRAFVTQPMVRVCWPEENPSLFAFIMLNNKWVKLLLKLSDWELFLIHNLSGTLRFLTARFCVWSKGWTQPKTGAIVRMLVWVPIVNEVNKILCLLWLTYPYDFITVTQLLQNKLILISFFEC